MIHNGKDLFEKVRGTISALNRAGMEQEAIDLDTAMKSSATSLLVLRALVDPLKKIDKSRLTKQAAEDVESEISFLDDLWGRYAAHLRRREDQIYKAATLFSRATVSAKGPICISDAKPGELPNFMGPSDFVAGTDSCILVRPRPAGDDTTIELTNDEGEFTRHEGVREYFTGQLLTPGRRVHVFSGDWTSIINMPISSERALVRIRGNPEGAPSWVGVLATGLEP